LSDDKEPPRKECSLCGHKLSGDEFVCPRCGNVFMKDEDAWLWKFANHVEGTAGKQAKNHQASPTRSPDDEEPSPLSQPRTPAALREAEKLVEILNAYEHDPTGRKDGFMKDVILAHPHEELDCFGLIDFSRSGTLYVNQPRQFVLTLKNGVIVGRGLFGKGPGEDDLEDSEHDIWRVWRIVWADGYLRCMRCGCEWKPLEKAPEQCPDCLGVLSRPLERQERRETP